MRYDNKRHYGGQRIITSRGGPSYGMRIHEARMTEEVETPEITLSVRTGPARGRTIRITQPHVHLGRARDNDFALPEDSTVSRYHAVLAWRAPYWLLDDCGSRNGTYLDLDGAPVRVVRPARVTPGQRFSIGGAELVVGSPDATTEFIEEPLSDPSRDGPPSVLHVDWNHDKLHLALCQGDADALRSEVACSRGEVEAITREVERLAGRAVAALDSRARAVEAPILAELSRSKLARIIGETIARRLAATGAPLVLDLGAAVRAVPWELASVGGEALCLHRPVARRLGSTTSASSHLAKTPNCLMIANPTDDLPDLQRASEALFDELREHFPFVCVDYLANRRATRSEVLARMPHADIVYYSGHAEFDAASNESTGWRLEDGLLTSADLAGLDRCPWLVFANGCQSARLTDASGPSSAGMAERLLRTGVAHYLGALWDIPADRSASAAIAFFHHLFRLGSPTRALQRARVSLREQLGPGDLIWAAYTLYSSGPPDSK